MSKEIQKWADPAMFEAEPLPKNEAGQVVPAVYLLQATPDPLGGIAASSMMYEGKVVRNLADVTDEDRRHYWEEIFKTHLRAPLEFVQFHFVIEGVTRAFTHQMVRQRTATYVQESMRFAVKEGMASEVPLPPSIADGSPESQVWLDTMEQVEEAYNLLVGRGIPAEDARGLLPTDVTTRIHYRTDLKSLTEHAGNRLCTQAQFAWRIVFARLVEAIREYKGPITGWDVFADENIYDNDWQFRLIADSEAFRPICFAKGRCPFKADFDRACTIRERADSGRFDEIRVEEWLLDPTAARRGD